MAAHTHNINAVNLILIKTLSIKRIERDKINNEVDESKKKNEKKNPKYGLSEDKK